MKLNKKIFYSSLFFMIILTVFSFLYRDKTRFNLSVANDVFKGDEALRQKFLSKLEDEGLKYRINKNGTILCLKNDSDKVVDILGEVTSKSRMPGVFIDDFIVKDYFIKLLEKNNIPFEREINYSTLTKEEWIRWEQKYNSQVKVLIIEIERKFLENSKEFKDVKHLSMKKDGL